MNDLWTALTQHALLGTGRQSFVSTAANDPVVQMVGLSTENEEQKLLSLIAVAAIARRAGRLAAGTPGQMQRAKDETLPPVSETGAPLLRRLVADCPILLPEFYARCQHVNRRIPEQLLVDVLTHAEANPPVRSILFTVLGARGHWLAAQNPAWHFATSHVEAASPEQSEPAMAIVWHTGSKEERLAAFRAYRMSQPEAARGLAEASWAQEPTDIRVEVLKAFQSGLSLNDEPFLEKALDDRRKEVRGASQALLAQLPDSAYSQRFLERAVACFKVQKQPRSFLGKLTGASEKCVLEIELPSACDKAMERDGIDAKVPAGQKVGERGWWLRQVLGKVLPHRLAEKLELSVEAFEKAAREHPEWGQEIVLAWAQAAKSCRDPELALRLYRETADASLLGIMRPEQREQLLIDSIAAAKPSDVREVVAEAAGMGAQLSDAVAQALLDYLRRTIASDTGASSYPWMLPWEMLALAIPPEACRDAVTGWPEKDAWQKHLDKFLQILHLRISIYQTLT
jgi:Family of unknown function (DUF5691)